jgi:hypothetical protein
MSGTLSPLLRRACPLSTAFIPAQHLPLCHTPLRHCSNKDPMAAVVIHQQQGPRGGFYNCRQLESNPAGARGTGEASMAASGVQVVSHGSN